jgi:HEAT repeat protein
VSLGLIRDQASVVPLTQVFQPRAAGGLLSHVRGRTRENDFVRRSAARSLGQIGNRAAVPTLIQVLSDEHAGDDVRREAALALGLLGDPAAAEALRAVLTARDPYLSRIAYQALHKLEAASATRPT